MPEALNPVDGRPRVWAAVAAVVSLGIAAAALASAAPGHTGIGVLVALATLWPTCTLAAAAMGRAPQSPSTPADGPPPAIGVVMRVGNEPLDVTRSSVLMNLASGRPVALTSANDVDPALRKLGVPVVVDRNALRATHGAATRLGVDAVVLVGGRAIVDTAAVAPIEDALRRGADWVVGTSEPVQAASLSIDPTERISATLRDIARRSGTELWENDAVAIRTACLTELLAKTSDTASDVSRRTHGAWLRRAARHGAIGSHVDARFSWRAQPTVASAYWPDAVARHRMRTRDALGALFGSPLRSGFRTLGVATYELSIVPVALWLAAPIWVGAGGSFPFETSPAFAGLVVGAGAVLRWFGLRRATGTPLRPIADVTAAAYRLPGSLRSLIGPSVRNRRDATSNPLAFGALVCTLAVGWGLVTVPAAQRPSVSVAVTVVLLGALWYVAVLGLAHGHWARTVLRMPVRFAATIDGVATSVINASPTGLAISPAPAALSAGPVALSIELSDGTALACTGSVVSQRSSAGRAVAGIRLSLTDQGRQRWLGQLATSLRDQSPDLEVARRPEGLLEDSERDSDRPTTARRALSAITTGAALLSVVALVAVLAGVQVAIIRSGSMVPTYNVGDVVLSNNTVASQLRVGDVAQIPSDLAASDQGERLTHRVIAIDVAEDRVRLTTQGDANPASELTELAAEQPVGRVWASVPWLGTALLWARHSWLAIVVGGSVFAALCKIVAMGAAARRDSRD